MVDRSRARGAGVKTSVLVFRRPATGPAEARAETVPDEDPAELIREVLAIEREITAGLEKLLDEVG